MNTKSAKNLSHNLNISSDRQAPSSSNFDKKVNNNEIFIIGAGWSGLACAVTLAHQGYKVCLLEAARQAGGRARSVNFKNFSAAQSVDNGQHIMLGAYHSTLSLFKRLGIKENDILERHTLELNLYSPDNALIQLKAPSLPAPLHLLFAFMQMKGLNFSQRFLIVKMALRLSISGYKIKQDISVSDLLLKHSQTPEIIAALWEPLCLATMNTPIKYASARVFLNVLKDSFNGKRENSDLLFFRQDLSRLFCAPAIEFITRHGGQINCGEKMLALEIVGAAEQNMQQETEHRFLIKTTKQHYQCHTLVIATPARIAEQLLQTQSNRSLFNSAKLLRPASASLDFQYEPICTIYLQYPPSTKLSGRMIGLFHSTAQWAIDRSLTAQPGLIAVIVSGPGKHTQMSHAVLAQTIHQELCLCVSDLPEVIDYQVITEKRATFSCRVNIEQQRPCNDTHISGLYLAGDYTNTHYPATLEGAIRSGCSAAEKIISRNCSRRFTL